MRILWTLQDWASAVVALPSEGPLPTRTVLVPNERVAHALRRALVLGGAQAALVGTRFSSLLGLARSFVLAAGERADTTAPELWSALVREAISASKLTRFDGDDLLAVPGWDDAFARTLSECADSALSPAALLASPDAQVRDVGAVFSALCEDAGLVHASDILHRAIPLIPARAQAEPILAVVTGLETPTEVQFLRALPDVAWALWAVRPVHPEHADRVASLFGQAAAAALFDPAPKSRGATALQHLQAGLFGDGYGPAAPRDDSVRIAIYAGVHEEVEAAVSWVVEQVVEHAVPAEQIAILSANAEPYASLLCARLSALPWGHDASTTLSERGVSLVERSDGARLLLALRALCEGLSREALAPLLPLLRTEDTERRLRGVSRAWELLNAVAVVGGDRGHPLGGLVWPHAWQRALLRLELAPASGGGLDEHEHARRTELRTDLALLSPAIEGLTDVLRHVLADEPLRLLGARMSRFAQTYLRLPPGKPPVWSVLETEACAFVGHEAREPRGARALAWLDDTLSAQVVTSDRFGTPRIYLGTFAGVRGLSFRAVRLLGLVEGAVPSAVREDPVLPDAARISLSPYLLTSRQRAHRQLAAFDDAVRATGERLALSAPRVSSEGSVRQPAAVLLDVMRVLRWTDEERGLEEQLEDAARAGRASERQLRERFPLSRGAQLERIAHGDSALAAAEASPALALAAQRAIRERTQVGVQDGLLPGVLASARVSGLSAERPISASRLATLLSCPHRYLYENLLGFREPTGPLPSHLLHVMIFGVWLHGIAEEFWRAHGAELGARKHGLEFFRAQLRALARERYEALRETYPFSSEPVVDAQREELCDQLDKLLVLDWSDGTARAFVDVERGFGYDSACAIETRAGALFVRGKIDKLDQDGDAVLVRDIKTGAGKPRKGVDPPDLSIDLQLAVYAQVASVLATRWGTPARLGVSYVYLRSGEPERRWVGSDYEQLDQAAQEWLATAVETLEQGSFVRSPRPDDCRFCIHKPVCAPEMLRARAVLDDPRVPRRLALLKSGDAR